MTSPNPLIKFTYEDYLRTPDDKRYELIDGELIRTQSSGRAHQRASVRLGSKLYFFVRKHDLGLIYWARRDVVLSDTDVVQPDLMFISNERMHIDTEAEVWGGPDLVVEILSPSTADRDRTVKQVLYARHGVKEYWLVDADARTIEVLLLRDRGFEPAATYAEGDTLVSRTLPGFSIPLSEIF